MNAQLCPRLSANGDVRPLHILSLSLEYTPTISGGVGTHAQELAAGLSKSDRVTVVACTLGKPERLSEENLTVYLLPPTDKNENFLARTSIAAGILQYNRQLVRFARNVLLRSNQKPDLIQCYNWITFPAARELARLLGVPVVAIVQFVSEPIENWWGQTPDPEIVSQESQVFQSADMIITVSNSMKAVIQRQHAIPDSKISVVHNGMDTRAFREEAQCNSHVDAICRDIASKNEKIVLYAGRIHPQKGISALLESAAVVLRRNKNVRYLVAGAPDSREATREFRGILDSDTTLRERLLLVGKLDRPCLAQLYGRAHVALVPSVYEPFGYAAIEAMAAGVPLVASDCGGLSEIVQHEQTGLLIPVSGGEGVHVVDARSLAEATERLLTDNLLANQLAEAARRRADEVFSLEPMVRATRRIYVETLARSMSPTA